MRLKFIPVIDILATTENQRSSQKGTCFDADKPVAFDIMPTIAVTAKWKPVNVVAARDEVNTDVTMNRQHWGFLHSRETVEI